MELRKRRTKEVFGLFEVCYAALDKQNSQNLVDAERLRQALNYLFIYIFCYYPARFQNKKFLTRKTTNFFSKFKEKMEIF